MDVTDKLLPEYVQEVGMYNEVYVEFRLGDQWFDRDDITKDQVVDLVNMTTNTVNAGVGHIYLHDFGWQWVRTP